MKFFDRNYPIVAVLRLFNILTSCLVLSQAFRDSDSNKAEYGLDAFTHGVTAATLSTEVPTLVLCLSAMLNAVREGSIYNGLVVDSTIPPELNIIDSATHLLNIMALFFLLWMKSQPERPENCSADQPSQGRFNNN